MTSSADTPATSSSALQTPLHGADRPALGDIGHMDSSHAQESGLKAAISDAQPLYMLPRDPVTEDVLIPALRASNSLDVMMGYFSSSSFAEIAPGLATFLRNDTALMRMVISPFLPDSDFETLTKDENELSQLAERLIFDDAPDEHQLVQHTLECLAWLITEKRLSIQVAVMRNALFHPKVWLFSDGYDRVALHGSTNFTGKGLSKNKEQLSLSREWKGDEAVFHIDHFRREFNDLWSGGDKNCYVMRLPDAVERRIVKSYKTEVAPDEDAIRHLWRKANQLPEPVDDDALGKSELKIPSHLIYDRGNFAHQGQAVDSWFAADHRGILEMATGSGKTITAMICATRLQDEVGKILVVISAPYVPLIEQWCGEIKEFGVEPINLSVAGGPKKRDQEIKRAARRLRIGNSKAEVLVVSNDTLCTGAFIQSISDIDTPKLLVADECHNLGATSFIRNPPEVFNHRLGLSATPVRQYDEAGTSQLISFFEDICFSFTLEDAIGKCLTEYDYHVHPVELADDEMEKWIELSDEIASLAWKMESWQDDPYIKSLLRQRRLVLETASKKLDVLERLLDNAGPRTLRHTLIYATDKDRRQLELVNEILKSRGVLFHQLTDNETRNRSKTERILSSFQSGMLQALTAKRVLDEGVNIPQIKLAFILASTTVTRQWVQRRGRLLRTCKEIGKTHAVIHDFAVLPTGASLSNISQEDSDAKKIIKSELARIWEFASLSRNGPEKNGAYEMIQHLQKMTSRVFS